MRAAVRSKKLPVWDISIKATRRPSLAEPSQAYMQHTEICHNTPTWCKTSSRGLDLLLAFHGCVHFMTEAAGKGQRMPGVIFSGLTTNGLCPHLPRPHKD